MQALERTVHLVVVIFEFAGVGTIVAAFGVAVARAVANWRRPHSGAAYAAIRSTFGRGILLGLEVLVAGDIIRTVALEPSLGNLQVLGLLVVIRTFLAWSIEVEIEGRWPWRRTAPGKNGDATTE